MFIAMLPDHDPYPRHVKLAILAGAAGMAALLVVIFWLSAK